MDKVNTGVDLETRRSVAKTLNQLLSDEYILVVKIKKYHWNVKGTNFIELHHLFDDQYEQVSDIIDDIAELTRTLGIEAAGSMKEFLEMASLKEDTTTTADQARMNLNLMADHEAIIRNMRAACASKDVNAICEVDNLLQEKMLKHAKMGWFLRSYNG